MKKGNFLEEKYIEINKLKSLLVTYPKEYKENIVEVMDKVCKQVEEYLNFKK